MARTATYRTTVAWKGEHWGRLVMGNGPEYDFSAPPDAHGHAGVFTPEDAFVAAANTCVMMMFIWAPSGSSSSCSPTSAKRRAQSSSNWTAPKSSPACTSAPDSRGGQR